MKSNSRRIEIIAHTTRAEYSTRTEKKKTSHDANKRRITSLTNRIAHPKKGNLFFYFFIIDNAIGIFDSRVQKRTGW